MPSLTLKIECFGSTNWHSARLLSFLGFCVCVSSPANSHNANIHIICTAWVNSCQTLLYLFPEMSEGRL